jgi:signal transduction histidine kinase
MIVREAMEVLTMIPGELGFHLIAMVALSILYGLARSATNRLNSIRGETWWSISEILLLLNALYLLAWGLTGMGFLDGRILLPVADRFVVLAGYILIIHGFQILGTPDGSPRWMVAALVIVLVGSLAAIIFLPAAQWADRLNRSLYDAAWGLLGLVILGFTGLRVLARKPHNFQLLTIAFAALSLGFAMHLALGPAESSHSPFVGWSTMLAYPLLIVAAASSFMGSQSSVDSTAVTVEVKAEPSPSESDYHLLPQVFVDMAAVMLADSPHALARAAVEGVGRSMKAELCLLLTPPEPSGYLSIATGFNLINERHIEGQALESSGLPVIAHALEQGHAVILADDSEAQDMATLGKALSLKATGPILLAPLAAGEKILGGLLICSPYARKQWPQDSRRSLVRLATLIAGRLQEAQELSESVRHGPTDLSSDLLQTRKLVRRLIDENSQLTQQLILATDQAGQDLAGLLSNHQLAEETISLLEAEIGRMREAVRHEPPATSSEEQVEELSYELQQALQELAAARARMAMMEGSAVSGGRVRMQPADVELIAALARDLRQPMSSVLGYAELLLDESVGLLNRKQREFLDHVRTSTERMALLLSNLVNLAAIETGTLSLVPTSIDILFPIEDAVTQVNPSIQRKGINLRVNLGKALPRVLGDPDALYQILIHLLNNAVGASPENGDVQIGARIAGEEQVGFLSLWVTDSGPGIPSEAMGKVFEPHYLSKESRVPGLGDDGVGLSIVKSLTQAMGGRIWVESLPEGATFTLLLPLAEQPTPDLDQPGH